MEQLKDYTSRIDTLEAQLRAAEERLREQTREQAAGRGKVNELLVRAVRERRTELEELKRARGELGR